MSFFRSLAHASTICTLTALTGCGSLTADNLAPSRSAPPARAKREAQGGLTVLVELPNQPPAARVLADLDTFVLQRGFVRQSAASGAAVSISQHYQAGKVGLEVSYESRDLRVVATLHSAGSGLSRGFVDRFYQDFRRGFAAGYGEEAAVFKNEYTDDSQMPAWVQR